MKKFYAGALLSLSCGAVMASVPGYPAPQVINHSGDGMIINPASLRVEATTGKSMKKPARLPQSLEDICINYQLISQKTFILPNGSYDTRYAEANLLFAPTSEADVVDVYGINIFTDEPVYAEVDLAGGFLSFPESQLIGNVQTTSGTSKLYLTHYTTDAQGYIVKANSPALIYFQDWGLVAENWDDILILELESPGSGQMLSFIYDIMMLPRPLSIENEEGWTNLGDATVKSIWFDTALSLDIDPYAVKAQSIKVAPEGSSEEHTIVRILNPYGAGTPFADYNRSVCEGALYFDVTNPECVGVLRTYPFLIGEDQQGNEIWIDAGYYSGLMGDNITYYPGNLSGYGLYIGESYEDIISELGVVSTLKDNVVTIGDPVYGETYDMNALYGYFYDEGDLGTPTVILPELEGGVETIPSVADGSFTVYNLQGMKVLQTKNEDALKGLDPGLYIINGKKYLVK